MQSISRALDEFEGQLILSISANNQKQTNCDFGIPYFGLHFVLEIHSFPCPQNRKQQKNECWIF